MIHNRLIYFLLIPCALFCSKLITDDDNNPANYERMAYKITHQTIEQIRREKQLLCMGTGGSMPHDVRKLSVSFMYRQKEELDVRSARELMVYIVDLYLENINADKELRPYLHVYPFTAENLEITVFIEKPNGKEVDPDNLYCISLWRNLVTYTKQQGQHIRWNMVESFPTTERLAHDRALAFAAAQTERWDRYDFRDPDHIKKMIARDKEVLKQEENACVH